MVEADELLKGIDSLQTKLDAVAATTSRELLSLKEEMKLLRGAIEKLSAKQVKEETATTMDEMQKTPREQNPKSLLADFFDGLKSKRSALVVGACRAAQYVAQPFQEYLQKVEPGRTRQMLGDFLLAIAFVLLVVSVASSLRRSETTCEVCEELISINRDAQNQQQASIDQLKISLTQSLEGYWASSEKLRAKEKKIENFRFARAHRQAVEHFYVVTPPVKGRTITARDGTPSAEYISRIIKAFQKGEGFWIPRKSRFWVDRESNEVQDFEYLQEKLLEQLHFLLGVKPVVREYEDEIKLSYPLEGLGF